MTFYVTQSNFFCLLKYIITFCHKPSLKCLSHKRFCLKVIIAGCTSILIKRKEGGVLNIQGEQRYVAQRTVQCFTKAIKTIHKGIKNQKIFKIDFITEVIACLIQKKY